MGLTVHHLQNSQSDRVVWLCEELQIPYDLKIYHRDPILAPPELNALTPMGLAPTITVTDDSHSDSKPLILSESGAVMEYIMTKFGHGKLMLKPDHPNYADYLYWFHFANGNLQNIISRRFTLSRCSLGPEHPMVANIEARLKKALGHVNHRLQEKDVTWFAGQEFTSADIITAFSLTTMRTFSPFHLGEYPGILAWLKRVGDRPGYQRAMKKGDPDLKPALGAEPPEMFPALAAQMKKN